MYSAWLDEKPGFPPRKIAVKTLLRPTETDDSVKLLQEAMIMAQFRHRNVVSLIGIVLQHNPAPLIVCGNSVF